MFSRTRWRIALPYALLMTAVLLGLGLVATRPSCLSNSLCVWGTIWGAIAVTAVGSFAVAVWLERRTNRRVRQMTQVARRMMAGDLEARVLAQSNDEIDELIRVFSQTITHLRQQIYAVQAENLQHSAVLNNMTDGVLITNESGSVRLINPAAVRLLQTQPSTAVGRSFAQAVRNHQLIELWQKAEKARSEQTQTIEINRELFLETSVIPFEHDGARHFLIILHDLTQIHRLQMIRRDFISNLSHELRTPLASLKAVVETLQDGALDDKPAADHFLQRAAIEVDVLTQMVEELLELSRIESGQVPFRFLSTAVADLLTTPLERLRPLAERKNIDLRLDIGPRLPDVWADQERVQRVITNLLHNAVKFTPDNGRITLQAVYSPEQPHDVQFSIQDTGVGINREDINRIFERFYKSDRARTRNGGGTGLGLAISRHIVQAHNGRIWVTSQEGKGSTFCFTLPIVNKSPKV